MRVENKPSVGKQPAPADKKPAKAFGEVLEEGRKQAQPPGNRSEQKGQGTAPKTPRPAGPGAGKLAGSPDAAGDARGGGPSAEGLGKKKRGEESAAPADIALAGTAQFRGGPTPAAVEQTASAAPTQAIERVADEIAVLTHADGAQEVQLEVDSKVLQDLRISITQRNGEVSIRLMTDSQQTARLLNEGMPQLMAALQARQVSVAGVQIAPRAVAPATPESAQRFRRKRPARDRDEERQR